MTSSRPAWSRTYALEGIEILSRAKGGDGRTVEAYAAVFDQQTEVHDQHGDYFEKINRAAFDRTISRGHGGKALVLYNHGMSIIDGRPMAEYGVPLGSPIEVKADGRGLLTRSRYNKSALADATLEAIKNDDIKGYSFRGSIFRSTPDRVPRARRGGDLPVIERMELGLSDFGPTPRPYYTGAEIVAVRSHRDVLLAIEDLPEDERLELIRALSTRSGSLPDGPDPATATSTQEPGAEDSRDPAEVARSGRLSRLRLRAALELGGKATDG